jgi:hypothetical protein
MADHIWIQFAENGNIRKWQSTPFDGGTEFVVAEKWYASNRAWHTSDAAREKAEQDAAFWKSSFQAESKARVELADELAGLKVAALNQKGVAR